MLRRERSMKARAEGAASMMGECRSPPAKREMQIRFQDDETAQTHKKIKSPMAAAAAHGGGDSAALRETSEKEGSDLRSKTPTTAGRTVLNAKKTRTMSRFAEQQQQQSRRERHAAQEQAVNKRNLWLPWRKSARSRSKNNPRNAEDNLVNASTDELELHVHRTVTVPARAVVDSEGETRGPDAVQKKHFSHHAGQKLTIDDAPVAGEPRFVYSKQQSELSNSTEPLTGASATIFKPFGAVDPDATGNTGASAAEPERRMPEQARTISVMIETLGDARFSDDG